MMENKAAWIGLCSDLYHLDNPTQNQELEEKDCKTYYGKHQMQNLAWTVSLALMSWALHNFKKKAEDEHCQDTIHPPW
jgi:hypothetical protein